MSFVIRLVSLASQPLSRSVASQRHCNASPINRPHQIELSTAAIKQPLGCHVRFVYWSPVGDGVTTRSKTPLCRQSVRGARNMHSFSSQIGASISTQCVVCQPCHVDLGVYKKWPMILRSIRGINYFTCLAQPCIGLSITRKCQKELANLQVYTNNLLVNPQ
jgi:hypothetical protein